MGQEKTKITKNYAILILLSISSVNSAKYPIKLYSATNFGGDSLTITELENVGDCVSFYHPLLWEWLKIPDYLRGFNDKTTSIEIPDGVCIRLYEHHCGHGRTLEVTSEDDFVNNLWKRFFWGGIVSSVELTCVPPPTPSPVTRSINQPKTQQPDTIEETSIDIPLTTLAPEILTEIEDTSEECTPEAQEKFPLTATLKIIGALRCAEFSQEVLELGDGLYQFRVIDDEEKLVEFYADLTTDGGYVGLGYTLNKPDATITLSEETFHKLFIQKGEGVLEYPNLQIEGDVTKAIQLEQALKQLETEYGGVDILNLTHYCIDDNFDSIDVAEDMKTIGLSLRRCIKITNDVVDKTKVLYEIEIEGTDGRANENWTLNLKSKTVETIQPHVALIREIRYIRRGRRKPKTRADVKLKIQDVAFVQIFRRQIDPSVAYLQRRLNFTGNSGKLLLLGEHIKRLVDGQDLLNPDNNCRPENKDRQCLKMPKPTTMLTEQTTAKISPRPTESTSETSATTAGLIVRTIPPTDALKIIGMMKCAKITKAVIDAAQGIFQYHVKQKYGKGLSFYYDFKKMPGKIDEGVNRKASIVLTMNSEENFVKIFLGQMDSNAAFTAGIIKIDGDLMKAMRLKAAMEILVRENGGKGIRILDDSVYC